MAYVSLCKALYDYAATAEDELTFTEDALLYVVEAEDDEWWKAKLKTAGDDDDGEDGGPVGLVPANYVEEAEPIRASRALYDYEKQNDDELDMQEDEMLSVYEEKGDWLLVKKQVDGVPSGKLGFVPANYVDEVAAVDGVTSAPLGGVAQEEEYEPAGAAIPMAPPASGTKTAKNDDIKMWAVSELDGKKKKKKGTLGIGNSSLFFASESDKAPVQKISVLSIVGHSVEGKGKQLNLELDDDGASKVKTDENRLIKYVTSNKGEVEEIWNKIEESQQKAIAANQGGASEEEEAAAAAAPTPALSSIPAPPPAPPAPPAIQQSSLPPPSRSVLPPPTRTVAATSTPPAAPTPPPAPVIPAAKASKQPQGEACIALYDFEAQGDDELSVAENEKLTLIERENDDWWKVQNSSGQEGVVPASYVEVGGDEEEEAAAPTSSSRANERDEDEYAAAAAAAAAAAEEEERQRQEEEEEAERARMQAERRAKADAQRRAREAEERRREAIKAQPAPAPPKAPATTATASASANSRDIAIPSGRSAPARPKEATSKAKPSPARTRIWHDRSGQFRVEAEFLGFNQGKIRLHKLNGVVIEVAVEKMSNPDIQYLEEVTGRKLSPQNRSRGGPGGGGTSSRAGDDGRRSDRDREKRREQEREQRRRQEAARGPKRNVDWFEFFLAAQVDMDDCTRYAAAFERDKIDENVLPDMDAGILRSIGLREGDIIRVMKFITKKYKTNGTSATAKAPTVNAADQMKSDEALARKLQEQEQNARRNGTTPPPGLFSGPDGSLKNNTRRGRPTPSTARSTSSGVDAASLAAASESLARTSSPEVRSAVASPTMPKKATAPASTTNGFDDDAWTPRPPSTKPTPSPQPAAQPKPAAVPAAPTPPPAPAAVAAAPSPQPAAAPPAASPAPAEPAKPAADPNSALFDKLAAMRPPSGGQMQRPGASPSNSNTFLNAPRGPYAPVAQNQSLLQPLIPTQGTGQFLPTSLGHQQTGMMQPQQTGYMGMQQTGYMGQPQQQTGMGYNNMGGMSSPQSPFGMQSMMSAQPTSFGGGMGSMQSPQFTGYPGQQQQQQLQPQMTNISGYAQQPLQPQYTQAQYAEQQQVRANNEANSESNPERFSAANIFGQMKQGRMHQDANKEAQSAQKYDALRAQPTGFQPGGYLNPQFTGYPYQQQQQPY